MSNQLTKGGCKLQRAAQTVKMSSTKGTKEIGNAPVNIEYLFIRPMARSTRILAFATALVF